VAYKKNKKIINIICEEKKKLSQKKINIKLD
jgi:hypothetical protein